MRKILLVIYFIGTFCNAEPIISDITESQCWFAGSEVKNAFSISGVETDRLSGQWRLSIANHTVMRGEAALNTAGGIAPFNISFTLPEVKSGIIADLILDLSVIDVDSGNKLVTTNKIIKSFSQDTFVDMNKWLKSLDIVLFDPEKTTAELFDNLKIPYRFTKNTDALTEINQGIVIVGEGVSLNENKGLWNVLVDVASRNVPVLCLALRDGEMKIPGIGTTDNSPKPSALTIKRYQAITDLNKSLDRQSWCGERMVASQSVIFKGERDQVIASIEEGSKNWLWLEQSFEGSTAKLVLCQFQIIKNWKQSPVPQYLLLNILENMCPQKTGKKVLSKF
ncbi:MAG: hypothetical protein PF692_05065 [Kiritimatiellae bacterium]|nr:hypothetical protein [Kiritimatiellia bacterium]